MRMQLQVARVEARTPAGTQPEFPRRDTTIDGKHTVPFWRRRAERIPLCCQDPFVLGVRVRDGLGVLVAARRVLALVRVREWLIRRAGRRGVEPATLD